MHAASIPNELACGVAENGKFDGASHWETRNVEFMVTFIGRTGIAYRHGALGCCRDIAQLAPVHGTVQMALLMQLGTRQ